MTPPSQQGLAFANEVMLTILPAEYFPWDTKERIARKFDEVHGLLVSEVAEQRDQEHEAYGIVHVRFLAMWEHAIRLAFRATQLRIAQRLYMVDRGNNDKGKAVGVAAAELDVALKAYSDHIERAGLPGVSAGSGDETPNVEGAPI